MTTDNQTQGNHLPVTKDDNLEDLKAGAIDTDRFMQMEHHVIVKDETEKFVRNIGDVVDYKPFVSSMTRGNGEEPDYYGDPKTFRVSNKRGNGAVDDDWEAIGLSPRVDKDGKVSEGYLIVKNQYDDNGRIVGRWSKIVDVVATEELTRSRQEEERNRLAGASGIKLGRFGMGVVTIEKPGPQGIRQAFEGGSLPAGPDGRPYIPR